MGGIASGLGGYCAIAEGTNGATGASGAGVYGTYFEVPTRAVPVKSAKARIIPILSRLVPISGTSMVAGLLTLVPLM